MAEQKGKSDLSLKQVLLRHRKKIEYETVPTRQPGMSLRVEKGGEIPKFTILALGALSLLGESFTQRKIQIKALEQAQVEPKKYLKNLAYTKLGLRGFQSVEGKFAIDITPTYSIAWNFDKLHKFLGPLYEALVTESLKTSIIIPLGRDTGNGPLDAAKFMEAINDSLLKLGIEPDEIDKLVNYEQVAEVDEKKIAELVANDQLTLTRGLGTVALSFAVEANPLEQ